MVSFRIKSGTDTSSTYIRNLNPLRAPEVRYCSGLCERHEPLCDVGAIVKREIPNQTRENSIEQIADHELFSAAWRRW
jgi:hypothetical protein